MEGGEGQMGKFSSKPLFIKSSITNAIGGSFEPPDLIKKLYMYKILFY